MTIIRLNQTEIDSAEEFTEQLKAGDITHGIMVYRTIDGDLRYRLFGGEGNITYIIGMLTRIAGKLNDLDNIKKTITK